MYYVYVLQSKDSERKHYIGFTRNLRKRLASHNESIGCKTTRNREWILIYYEAYLSDKDARRRERRLKDGRSVYHLKTRIKESLHEG